eukprot:4068337-Ditylum_brightwellii.AAC.1
MSHLQPVKQCFVKIVDTGSVAMEESVEHVFLQTKSSNTKYTKDNIHLFAWGEKGYIHVHFSSLAGYP